MKDNKEKNNMNCENCKHYSLKQMITEGPYGYSGKIPCLTCSRFSIKEDNFEPKNNEKVMTESITSPDIEFCEACGTALG